MNDSVENYKSTARELVAGRVSVDTDATITRSEIEENESILDRCVMSREDIFMSADMVDYTIADWVLYNDRESGSTSLGHSGKAVKAQFTIDLSGMFEAKDGSSRIEATLCCSRQLNLNILRNGWRITRGDSAGIIREDEYEAVNASDDHQRCIGKAYHEVSSKGFGRAHDFDCWEVKRVDLAIFIELAWADHSISKVLGPIRAWADSFVISKASEESSWDVIECGKAVESSLNRASESVSSRDEMVGRERYGSRASVVMNDRVLCEMNSLDNGIDCDTDHENVKQGRVLVVAQHSHVDRIVSWMIRLRENSSSKVESCTADRMQC